MILIFLKIQDQEQVLNDAVDGKEIYNTIRRKTKDAFYKNIVKKGYLLKKGNCKLLRLKIQLQYFAVKHCKYWA